MASVSEATDSPQGDPKFLDLFAALAAPFDPHEVRTRSQGGRQLHYITARVAMNRLDSVVGPSNWWDEYTPGENSVICRLSICLPDGHVLTKQDAGGYAGMADQGDDDKSGFSDAFKRACVKFGIGRFLYGDGVPAFVRERQPGTTHEPKSAHPVEEAPPPRSGQASQGRAPYSDQQRHHGEADRPQANGSRGGNGNAPRNGRALFAWTKEQEEKHDVGLLKYINNWSKLQDFPGRMVDWDEEQVRLAHAEAVRKLQSVGGGPHGDAHEEGPAY